MGAVKRLENIVGLATISAAASFAWVSLFYRVPLSANNITRNDFPGDGPVPYQPSPFVELRENLGMDGGSRQAAFTPQSTGRRRRMAFHRLSRRPIE